METENEDLESSRADALEQVDTVVVPESAPPSQPDKKPDILSSLRRRPPIKTLLIGLATVLLLSGVGITITIRHKPAQPQVKVTINTQSLDNGTLNKLTTNLAENGKVQPQLTISPSTLFKSGVSVEGVTNLLGPVATGNNLTVGGGLAVSRNASVGGSLSVSGGITAGSLNVGSINLSTLSLSGDFSWSGHLISTGTAPTTSSGPAIVNGNVTVTGNDSVGTVVITAGNNGTLSDGEMATIHFHAAYTATPIVQLTPTNQGAAGLQYYVVAARGFFAIRTISTPAAGTQYVFNYFVTQ